MIVEEIIVKSNTTDAEAGAKRVQASYDGAFRSVERSATKAADTTTKAWKQAPEQFSKARGAILLMDGALASMGGRAAEVGQKLSGVASLLSVGGTVGVAIAAATVAVGVFASAWKALNAEQQRTQEIMIATSKAIDETWGKTGQIREQMRGAVIGVPTEVLAAQRRLMELGVQRTVGGRRRPTISAVMEGEDGGRSVDEQEVDSLMRLIDAHEASIRQEKALALAASQLAKAREEAAGFIKGQGKSDVEEALGFNGFFGPQKFQQFETPPQGPQQGLFPLPGSPDFVGPMQSMAQANPELFARLTKTAQEGMTEIVKSNTERRADLIERETDRSIASYQRMASQIVPIVQGMSVGVVDYFERSQQLSVDAAAALADGNIAAYESLKEQQDALLGQMLKDFLSSTGKQLIGQGIASVASSIWPINPAGIAAGAAQIAIGTGLAAGSLAIPAEVSSVAGIGGGVAGAGGASPSMGSAGPASSGDKAPIVIVVDGGYSEAERILLLRRGIAAAQARGAI